MVALIRDICLITANFVDQRVDDVVNVSGHRISTAEIERVLLKHGGVSEVAVIGVPDSVTGQARQFCEYTTYISQEKFRHSLSSSQS